MKIFKWFRPDPIVIEKIVSVPVPILIDENNVEYEVLEQTPLQWHIRPISILIEEKKGYKWEQKVFPVPVGGRFIDGFKAGLEHQCLS